MNGNERQLLTAAHYRLWTLSSAPILGIVMRFTRLRRQTRLAVYFWFWSVVVLCGGHAAAAPQDAEACSSSELVLQRYVDALGGKAALGQVLTRTAEAKVLEPSFKPGHPEHWKYSFEWKSPDKVIFKKSRVILNTAVFKFDGQRLWTKMRGKPIPVGGGGQPDAPFIWMIRLMADPLMFANPDTLYSKVRKADPDFTQEHKYCVLEAIPSEEHQGMHSLFFDAQTGFLRVVQIQYRRGALFIHLDDYRETGGVKFPFHIFCDSPLQITADFQKVKNNPPLHDSDFMPN